MNMIVHLSLKLQIIMLVKGNPVIILLHTTSTITITVNPMRLFMNPDISNPPALRLSTKWRNGDTENDTGVILKYEEENICCQFHITSTPGR